MRNVVIIAVCAGCELALLAAAVLAGAPVGALVRGAVRRGANTMLLCSLAAASWVLAGLAINAVVGSLPDGGQFATGILRIGDTDFNLAVFVPMMGVSLVIGVALALSLAAASRGLVLGTCLRAATRLSAR